MIYDQLEYRMLDATDKDHYLNFVSTILEKNKDRTSVITKNSISLDVTLSDIIEEQGNFATAGGFLNGELVTSISAYFPDNNLTWFSFNQFSNLPNLSLNSALDFQASHMKVLHVLQNIAESNNRLSFFSRRTLRQARIMDTLWHKMDQKALVIPRYIAYYDGYYQQGRAIDNKEHGFYRANPQSDSVVILHVLKQEEREKLFFN